MSVTARRAAVALCVLVCLDGLSGSVGAREPRRGTLAVQLRVDRGGPPRHTLGPVRLRLLLRVSTLSGATVVRTERYILSGHTLTYRLLPGQYRVSARAQPPVVNPAGRPCNSASPAVTVRPRRETDTHVTCVLNG